MFEHHLLNVLSSEDKGTVCNYVYSYVAFVCQSTWGKTRISEWALVFIHILLSFFSPNSYSGKAGYVPAMYLQPYNYPHIRMTVQLQDFQAPTQLQLPSSGLKQSHQLSRSQGNLLQLPSARSPSPSLLQPDKKQRSHSLTILPEQPPLQPAARVPATNVATTPFTAKHAHPPVIKVEMDGQEEHGRTLSTGSERCLGSDSSDSIDLSFSDDLSCSSASSCFSLSHSANDEQLRFSRTPPPTVSNHLSPTSYPGKKITPSASDPHLYKGSTAPKVPPRPRAQEIHTRCSSVTRKNASKVNVSAAAQTEILSRWITMLKNRSGGVLQMLYRCWGALFSHLAKDRVL